jgi:hypothetical protein
VLCAASWCIAGAAAQDVGAYGDLGHLIHFRPKLGDKLVCTCPMVCLVNSGRGLGSNTVPQAVPLETSMLQYNVQCHISQAFVDLQLVCQFPNVSRYFLYSLSALEHSLSVISMGQNFCFAVCTASCRCFYCVVSRLVL